MNSSEQPDLNDIEYDCVVIGVGGIGSAALLAAAERGWNVLGIERFGLAHNFGSSHGQSRIIRRAYFEHPSYVPLTELAYQRWHEIDAVCEKRLLETTGLLQIGPPDGEVVRGVLQSATEHGLEVEQLSAAEIRQRFPIFNVVDGHVGVFEPGAGLLRVEWCVAQMTKMALESGARLKTDCTVRTIRKMENQFEIETPEGVIKSRRLIICNGAWTGELLGGLNLNLKVIQKGQHWFQLDRIEIKIQNGFPAFLIETANGCFYGLPELDHLGMKVAEHSGGKLVSHPDQLDRNLDLDELGRNKRFLEETFEFSRKRLVHDSVCMYTLSADQHFIVDLHPDLPDLAFAAGLSGHGFKFAPVIGEHLVRLLDSEPGDSGEEETYWQLFEFLRLKNRDLFLEDGPLT